jgi:hypothetical protein
VAPGELPAPAMGGLPTNRILAGLPGAELERLLPLLEPVTLAAGERLPEADGGAPYVYFPEGAVLSYRAVAGAGVEVALVGREGAAGLWPLLGPRADAFAPEVLAGGGALRARASELGPDVAGGGALLGPLLAYAGEYLAQVAQRAACNLLHRAEQRVAVWLLLLDERLGAGAAALTHERIARHLGLRRAGVSHVLGRLAERGAVSYERGLLRVLDRAALEAAACGCYSVMSQRGREHVPA